MEELNTFFVLIGVISVGMGIYILFTKKLIGRSIGKATKETVKKFIPIEVTTYIVEGLLMIIMGLPQYFPFVEKSAVVFSLIGVALVIIVVNVVVANKFFPDAGAENANKSRRLR